MKVGLYVRDLAPEAGGGHTYEHDVLAAINAIRDTTRHSFVAVGYAPDPPEGWDASSYVRLAGSLGRRTTDKVWHRMTGSEWGRRLRVPRSRVDRVLDTHAIDLVWCVAAGTPTRELPYVTTIWDLQHRLQPVFPEVASRNEWAARERFYSREIGQATRVIVGTDVGRAEVHDFYGVPPERIRKLPHPTPSFALQASTGDDDTLARFGLEPGYVFYPAQFWAHKNHVGLLRALSLLRNDHDVHLQAVFVGSDKGNEAHVRRVVEGLGLGDSVRFLGFVPRSDLVMLYRHAFALAYMTYFGPENLPPLEAFALGCPVVASDVPGASEQLGDAALLAPPGDPSRIAEALLAIHRDEALRRSLIDRGRQRARAYTATDFAAGMVAVIDEVDPVVRTWR